MMPILLPMLLLACDLTVSEGSAYTVAAGADRTVCLDGGADGIFDFTVNNQLSHASGNTGKITWTLAPGTTSVRNNGEFLRNFRHLNNRGPMRVEDIVAIGDELVSIVVEDGGDSLQVINCDGSWGISVTPVLENDVFGVYIRDCEFAYDFMVDAPISISAALEDDPESDCYYEGNPLNFYSTSETYRFFMDNCTVDVNAGIGGGGSEDYVIKNYAFSGQMDSVTVRNPLGTVQSGHQETTLQWFCSNYILSNSRFETSNAERMITIRGHTDLPACQDEPLYYFPSNNLITDCVFVNYGTSGNGVAIDCADSEVVGCSIFAPGNYGSTAHVLRASEEATGNTFSNNLLVVTSSRGTAILNQGPGLLTIENCSVYTQAMEGYNDEWGVFFNTKTYGDSTAVRNCLFVDGYTGTADHPLMSFESTPGYFEFDNNVFQTYGVDVPFRIADVDVETIAELESSYANCDNNILIDYTYYKEMVDPTATEGGDYNIHYASRSFDYGLDVLNTYNVVTDINGDGRVLNADVDAGSDEVAAQIPVGACCYNSSSGRSCQIMTLSACESNNGTYKGDWQECSPWPCSQNGGNGGGGGGGKVLPTQPGGGSGGGN